MKGRASRILLVGLLLAAAAMAGEPAGPSGADDPVLRARLLDFGGALANDGFRLRDSFWSGRLEPGQPRRLAVNLFAGNQYWFCATVSAPASGPGLVLYDPQGVVVAALDHTHDGVVAAGVTAATTGRYVVEIKTARGPAADFCLLYLFK
jgi:hypothetical protein